MAFIAYGSAGGGSRQRLGPIVIGPQNRGLLPSPYYSSPPLYQPRPGGLPATPSKTQTTQTTSPKVSYDPASDPVLQDMLAASNASISAHQAALNSNIRDALLTLGSKDLASKLLGPGDSILGAISDADTSASTLGRLHHQNILDLADANNANAANNTYFGSARSHDLAEADRAYTLSRNDAIANVTGTIRGWQQQEADYETQIRAQEQMAQMYAALAAALAAAQQGGGSQGSSGSSQGQGSVGTGQGYLDWLNTYHGGVSQKTHFGGW